MTFFDRKEEVIDIELTQYGKQLLSKGKFKPAYYQFFDDDIIYDNQYTGQDDEIQKDTQTRIKETPRTHVQYTFVSPETELKRAVEQVRSNKKGSFSDIYVPFNLKHRVMSAPLAHAEIGQQKKPSWNIQSYTKEFSSATTYTTGTYSNTKTPRLKLKDLEFKIGTANDSAGEVFVPGDVGDTVSSVPFRATSDLNMLSSRFKDNTYIHVQEDYILLDLQEINSQFKQENFEIELYELVLNEEGEEEQRQLYFNKKTEQIVNNILEDSEQQIADYKPNRTDMAESFFLIRADREISSEILCKNLSEADKQTLVATNQIDLECEELYGTLTDPRITSDVKPEDLLEKC